VKKISYFFFFLATFFLATFLTVFLTAFLAAFFFFIGIIENFRFLQHIRRAWGEKLIIKTHFCILLFFLIKYQNEFLFFKKDIHRFYLSTYIINNFFLFVNTFLKKYFFKNKNIK